jgi:hypothetical protein
MRPGSRRSLVSRFDKTLQTYELTEVEADTGQTRFVLAAGRTEGTPAELDFIRCVPQVGAGFRLFTYSRKAAHAKLFALPPEWAAVPKVDRYRLSFDREAMLVDNLAVAGKDVPSLVLPTMDADTLYMIVPAGLQAKPTTVNFYANKSGKLCQDGEPVSAQMGLEFLTAAAVHRAGKSPQDPAAAEGVFATNAVRLATNPEVKAAKARLRLPAGGVFHSARVGNLLGMGTIELVSSNPANAKAVLVLPEPGTSALLETHWLQPETGELEVRIGNDIAASGVLLNYLTYSCLSGKAATSR